MNEKELFEKRLAELMLQCDNHAMITHTFFLDAEERSEAIRFCSSKSVNAVFFGGYDDAERTVCVFFPDYFQKESFPQYFIENPDDSPICALRCEYASGSPHLTHRDFLGALMALGIKREMLGDIIVGERTADIFVISHMAKYISENFNKAGRVPLTIKPINLNEINMSPFKTERRRDTVPSLRLDALIASVFSLSRSKAEEAIVSGIVFVNDRQILKTDAKISEGSKLVLRGSGKAVLVSASDVSKKGRTIILFDKYL